MSESIAPADLADRLARGERTGVVDVRDRQEFEEWHVDGPGAEVHHVPHAKFLQAQVRGGAADLVDDVPQPMVLVCAVGEASGHAAELLREAGLDAANLEGGMDAWADVAVARPLSTPDGANVRQYHRPATGCLSYLLVDGHEAAVVDPLRAVVDRYVADAADAGVDIRFAIDTHVHADHLSGVRRLAEATDAEPVFPESAWERGLEAEASALGDGETLSIGTATTIEAVHAPGHTTEMTALHVRHGDAEETATADGTGSVDSPGTLLSGDSLFVDGVARPDLEAEADAEAAAARLHETLGEFEDELPARTLVAPGHVRPTTAPNNTGTYAAPLEALLSTLAAFEQDREAFVASVTGDLPPPPANAEEIVAANLGLAAVDDPESLELGPNNCAAGTAD